MKSTRLAGHALPYEGRVKDSHGQFVAVGPAVCSCGAISGPLTSANARKRWHAEHKAAVRAAQTN
ncbi:hypothetical protein GCM10011608_11030 [Micromonospora sonchi]|uniref:Uncharacterized protein n=1 Tax=Micromonospora sonchi TaxID=1763543 RepID=A0A917TMN0_9ACTN|nr:hypothetical protein GCM10011608_11030 [Micromonospora sonchi]